MDKLKRVVTIALLPVVMVLLFAPVTGHALQRPANQPSIIVLDGRTEPPISVTGSRAETKPRRTYKLAVYVPVFGLRLVTIPSLLEISRTWR